MRIIFQFILSFFILSACGNEKKSVDKNYNPSAAAIEQKDGLSCSITADSLKGRQYLDEKFIANIESIPVNEKLANSTEGMKFIKGGEFQMGGDLPPGFEKMESSALAQPDEFPKHPVRVSDFYMDEHEVTVREFKEFVDATGYKTVAEYEIDWDELKKQLPAGTPKPDDELLVPGSMVFHYVPKTTAKDNLGNWWEMVAGANWRNPDGTNPSLESIMDQPVRQVSWYDALAYAKWKGKRLPTEAEYEYAMRGGLQDNMYPWGNEKLVQGVYKGNFLQGDFPYNNTGADGYMDVADVMSFDPNGYGLYDIAGNVWEWTMDWYGSYYYKLLSDENKVAINPKGPESTLEVYDQYATNKVVRGGSFLCNDGWCSGYRNSRRMRLSPDSGMEHLGFRCVRDVAE